MKITEDNSKLSLQKLDFDLKKIGLEMQKWLAEHNKTKLTTDNEL